MLFEGCVKLSELILPDGAETIGNRAFYKCKELKKVRIPDSVIRIGEQAFYFCKLEELQLPDVLQELGDKAFFKCNGLKSVLIPKSVQKIGEGVFHGCNRLEYLEIHHDPEEIGPGIDKQELHDPMPKGKSDGCLLRREWIKDRIYRRKMTT